MIAGELPNGWDEDIPTFATADKPIATRSAGGKIINAIAAARAGAPRRLGRPQLLDGDGPQGGGRLPEPGDRRAARTRARSAASGATAGRNIHYGVREHAMAAVSSRPRAPRRRHPVLGHLLHLRRLHAPGHPPRRAHEAPLDLRLHPRQHRRRRGRADPPADRARRLAAGDPAAHGDPARGRQRDGLRVARGDDAARADRARCSPARPCPSSPAPTTSRYGGYVLADTDGRPDVILIATGSEVALALEARGAAGRSRHQGPRRQPALVGALRRAAAGLPRHDPPAVGPGPRRGRGRRARRAGRSTPAPSARWSASRTASAPRPRSRW